MSAYDRAKAAAAAAEAAQDAGDHRTAQAYRAAAATWERLSRPGVAWSSEPAWQQLKQLKRDFAAATGPFQPPPAPPKAPRPAQQPLIDALRAAGGPAARQLADRLSTATIEF